MKLGWCAPLEQAAMVQAIGYDYLEVPLAAFPLEDDTGLKAAKRAVKTSPLPLTVFSRFYPPDMRVVGPDVDKIRIQSWLKRAAELTHHAGAETVILGSAWARNVPDGFSRQIATQQNLESYAWVADAFAPSGIRVGIEAQNRKEANLILTLAEAAQAAQQVNRPDVIRAMADFYHMDEENEPLSHLRDFAPWIAHVQVADSNRLNPGTGTYDYDSFFRYLKEGGYDSTMSVECMVPIPEAGMKQSLDFLRAYCSSGKPT